MALRDPAAWPFDDDLADQDDVSDDDDLDGVVDPFFIGFPG
jgi:hypothetical protein